jgi:2-dehydropantoate 2-reductase
MNVVVLGAGAVGAYYGGVLSRAGHEVTCLARGANLTALRERGLEVRTPEGTHFAKLNATDVVDKLPPADFAILAVKSYSLDAIAPAVRHSARAGAVIVPLLNGVETAERLVELGVPAGQVIGGLTRISVVRVAPGVVERHSAFQTVTIGEFDGAVSPRVNAIAAAFREAGVDARVSEQIRLELWRKFVFITALAAGCGLARAPVGQLLAQPLGRRLLERAIREVVAVGRAKGIPFPDDEESRHIGLIDGLPPGIKPSFLVDLESGGPTELEVLSGAVSRFAPELGIDTPIHDTATAALAPRGSQARSLAAGPKP